MIHVPLIIIVDALFKKLNPEYTQEQSLFVPVDFVHESGLLALKYETTSGQARLLVSLMHCSPF